MIARATPLGIVGVGRMGANMARRLKECGFTLAAIHDTRPDAARALAQELGAQASPTLAGVTERARIILTVVSDDRAMRAIFAPRGDSLLRGARGRSFINCATITPAVHLEIERLARRAGARAIEACMASSIPQARQGTLALMCGGERATFRALLPLLKALSPAPRWIGSAGRAAQVKALVNMVMNINTAGLAEGLALGEALGLDLDLLREVFSQTGANSRVLETDGADMQHRAHECYFSAAHAAKDSSIALVLGRQKGLRLPLAAATARQYARMKRVGLGELDKSGIAELTFRGRGGRGLKRSRD
ncbi:MAG: NAD(P)-dependent oxidoreductase [Verrucomicrobiae bacterium]|nr:NAD(P)-dependent oxidoreductase [Verrucomicrobiae bacterium]